MGPADTEETALGVALAEMLYADREHRPEQRVFTKDQLLLVREIGRVRVLHFGRHGLFAGHVNKEFQSAEAETHRQSLRATETLAELLASVEPERTLEWSKVTCVRFDRHIVTVSVGGQAEVRSDIPDPEPVTEWFRAHLPGFTTHEAKRRRAEILKDAGCLSAFAALAAPLVALLGLLLDRIEWLAGLARYLVGGIGCLLATFMLFVVFATFLRLRNPEGVVELRPRDASGAYR